MATLNEIKDICTNKNWGLINPEIKHYTSESLDALRVFLLSGIAPKESMELVDFAIDLSILTTLDAENAAIEILKILNKFNNGLQ